MGKPRRPEQKHSAAAGRNGLFFAKEHPGKTARRLLFSSEREEPASIRYWRLYIEDGGHPARIKPCQESTRIRAGLGDRYPAARQRERKAGSKSTTRQA